MDRFRIKSLNAIFLVTHSVAWACANLRVAPFRVASVFRAMQIQLCREFFQAGLADDIIAVEHRRGLVTPDGHVDFSGRPARTRLPNPVLRLFITDVHEAAKIPHRSVGEAEAAGHFSSFAPRSINFQNVGDSVFNSNCR